MLNEQVTNQLKQSIRESYYYARKMIVSFSHVFEDFNWVITDYITTRIAEAIAHKKRLERHK